MHSRPEVSFAFLLVGALLFVCSSASDTAIRPGLYGISPAAGLTGTVLRFYSSTGGTRRFGEGYHHYDTYTGACALDRDSGIIYSVSLNTTWTALFLLGISLSNGSLVTCFQLPLLCHGSAEWLGFDMETKSLYWLRYCTSQLNLYHIDLAHETVDLVGVVGQYQLLMGVPFIIGPEQSAFTVTLAPLSFQTMTTGFSLKDASILVRASESYSPFTLSRWEQQGQFVGFSVVNGNLTNFQMGVVLMDDKTGAQTLVGTLTSLTNQTASGPIAAFDPSKSILYGVFEGLANQMDQYFVAVSIANGHLEVLTETVLPNNAVPDCLVYYE